MFKLHSEYKPTGDQPKAIEYLSNGIINGKKIPNITWCYWFSEKHLQWLILYNKFKNLP